MITLSKLTLKNFKIFDGNAYSINFQNSDLILLDGPNGYGKTSVFDAIELGLTGNISRFIALESKQNPTDVVVAHNGATDVEIEIEFQSDQGVRLFQRKLKKNIPNSLKKISNFKELWELNEIVNDKVLPVDKTALDNFFGSSDLSRDYLFYHYVQQEETSRFLKNNNEVQRAEELSKLFGDTRKTEERLQKLTNACRRFSAVKKDITNKIVRLKDLYNINDNTSISVGNAQSHFFLLHWLTSQNKTPFWDAESIPELNQEKLNSILDEIDYIKKIIKHKDFYLKSRSYEVVARQTEIITLYVAYYNAINNHKEIILNQEKYNKIRNSLKMLNSFDYKKIEEGIDFDLLFKSLNLENKLPFELALKELNNEHLTLKGLSSVFLELYKNHQAMQKETCYLEDNSICQLCGHDHKKYDALKKAIDDHGNLLKKELGLQEQKLITSRESFNTNFLRPIIEKCENHLKSITPLAADELININQSVIEKDRLEKLRSWLIAQNIIHDELLLTSYPIEGGTEVINKNVEKLRLAIIEKIGSAPKDYHEDNAGNVFDRIYRDYFNKKPELLRTMKEEDVNKKENYVKSVFFISLRKILDELNDYNIKNDNLGRAIDDINKVIVVIKKQIRKYRKKLITDIEIPFYLYSGKILQTHQAGLGEGIFIKDPTGEDELRNVRFVSNWESDHDVLNTMSSGQISAVVISLVLALNKVYCRKLSSILIDDPVQTMDDINMSSLIEVLRNDFKNKQLIMSTHEEKVSRYFTYKYLKHNFNVKIVNLMERKVYIPGNKYSYSIL